MTLTLLADFLFGRDFVTGSLAIGCIAALIGAIYLSKASEDAQAADDANHQDTDE